jgi:hypothetical protein
MFFEVGNSRGYVADVWLTDLFHLEQRYLGCFHSEKCSGFVLVKTDAGLTLPVMVTLSRHVSAWAKVNRQRRLASLSVHRITSIIIGDENKWSKYRLRHQFTNSERRTIQIIPLSEPIRNLLLCFECSNPKWQKILLPWRASRHDAHASIFEEVTSHSVTNN